MNTVLLPADQMRKPGSCGKPIPGVEIELVDDAPDGRRRRERRRHPVLLHQAQPPLGVEVALHHHRAAQCLHRQHEAERGGVVQRHFDPEGWLRLVEEHRVTTSFSAPTPIRRVVDLPEEVRARYDTSSMQRLIANAAPWPFELK